MNGEKGTNGRWLIEGLTLALLGKEYRKLTVGMSVKDVAEKKGVSINSIYWRLHLDKNNKSRLAGDKICGQWRINLD